MIRVPAGSASPGSLGDTQSLRAHPRPRRSRICVYQALQAILSEQRSHASARLTPHCVLTGGKGLGAEGNGGTRRSPHSQGCSSVTSPERDSAEGRGGPSATEQQLVSVKHVQSAKCQAPPRVVHWPSGRSSVKGGALSPEQSRPNNLSRPLPACCLGRCGGHAGV